MQENDKINLYRSLFRGRDDIFARRWEKNGKSGYSPAYSFDWDEFNAHRARGGTLKDLENKTPIPLTDEIVREHLTGRAALACIRFCRITRPIFWRQILTMATG